MRFFANFEQKNIKNDSKMLIFCIFRNFDYCLREKCGVLNDFNAKNTVIMPICVFSELFTLQKYATI